VSTLIEEQIPITSNSMERSAVHWIFPRWVVAFLAIAIVLPWLAVSFLLASQNATSGNSKSSPVVETAGSNNNAASDTAVFDSPRQSWVRGEKGPWGSIESIPFALDVPEGCVLAPPAPPVRWNFPGYDKSKVLATLRSVGIPEADVHQLESSAKWISNGNVIAVEPGDPFVLGLAPKVRAKLYAILIEFPQNTQQIVPACFHGDEVDRVFQDSGLSPESMALFKRLLYPLGKDRLVFADFDPVLRSMPDDAERRRFMMASLRQRTILARVQLDPDTDVEELAQYWGLGGRRKDLLPFLRSLHRDHERSSVNIVSLLPKFARDRLYCHPCDSAYDKNVVQDCFWSAYNFFNDPPDNSYADTHSNAGLNKDCYQISYPNQLGDLMILTAHDGTAVHAAVFLADNIYFSKNGLNRMEPWILIYRDDLLEQYRPLHPSGLDVHYFRRMGF
jgi:hypothetical protein